MSKKDYKRGTPNFDKKENQKKRLTAPLRRGGIFIPKNRKEDNMEHKATAGKSTADLPKKAPLTDEQEEQIQDFFESRFIKTL